MSEAWDTVRRKATRRSAPAERRTTPEHTGNPSVRSTLRQLWSAVGAALGRATPEPARRPEVRVPAQRQGTP